MKRRLIIILAILGIGLGLLAYYLYGGSKKIRLIHHVMHTEYYGALLIDTQDVLPSHAETDPTAGSRYQPRRSPQNRPTDQSLGTNLRELFYTSGARFVYLDEKWM